MTTSRVPGEWERIVTAWQEVPDDVKLARVALAALIGLGVAVTAMASFVYGLSGPIPWKILPDVRPVLLFLLPFTTALYAGWGPRSRRVMLLYLVGAASFGFHLEAATVHWVVSYDGTITGSRVDVIQLAGTVLAFGATLALHADVAAWRFARHVQDRGVPQDEAAAAARALTNAGRRRAGILAGLAVGIGGLVALADPLLGGVSLGPTFVALIAGAALLAAAAYFAFKAATPRTE